MKLWQIKVPNIELKEVGCFKYLGSAVTRDDYCTREIKMIIVMIKEAVNKNYHSVQAS